MGGGEIGDKPIWKSNGDQSLSLYLTTDNDGHGEKLLWQSSLPALDRHSHTVTDGPGRLQSSSTLRDPHAPQSQVSVGPHYRLARKLTFLRLMESGAQGANPFRCGTGLWASANNSPLALLQTRPSVRMKKACDGEKLGRRVWAICRMHGT